MSSDANFSIKFLGEQESCETRGNGLVAHSLIFSYLLSRMLIA